MAPPTVVRSRRRVLALGLALGLCLSALAPVTSVYAAAIVVTTTTDELNADGDCSLREAVRAANADTAVDACAAGSGADTITVPAGTYTTTLENTGEDETATGDFDLTADVTITGAGTDATIVQPRSIPFDFNNPGEGTVFHVVATATVTIANLTVQGGGRNRYVIGAGIRNSGSLTLRNVAVRDNGDTTDPYVGGGTYGGGIANGGTLSIVDSRIADNGANDGGGIANGGTLTISGSTLSGNRSVAGYGGAIYNAASGSVTVTDSTISDNANGGGRNEWNGGGIYNLGTLELLRTAVIGNVTYGGGIGETLGADGGGILNLGQLTVVDSTISENEALGGSISGGGGGGLANYGTATLSGTTVSDNRAGGGDYFNASGGGIANGGTLELTNVTVSGNSAEGAGGGDEGYGGRGGGIANGGTLRLNNVTIAGNTAADGAALPGTGGGLSTSKPVDTGNTILAGNTATEGADCSGTLQSRGYNLLQSTAGCTFAGVTTGNQTGVDPRLGPLADNGGPSPTRALLPGSPALDAASPAAPGSGASACDATDQRGIERPQDGDTNGTARCDLGAFELAPELACPPGARAISAFRYTITRGGRSFNAKDLTGRVQQGDRITAFVTVAPACDDIAIGLVAYNAQAPAYDPALEQLLYADDSAVVDTGEHQLEVTVPSCYFQADLIVGPVLERIGPPDAYYGGRMVDYATGGATSCAGVFDTQPTAGAAKHMVYLGFVGR